MVTLSSAYSGFAVTDLGAARDFYRSLGLEVVEIEQGLDIMFPDGGHAFVYPKPDHEPAGFTVFYLDVPDIDVAIDELAAIGITPLRYEGFPQDEKGVLRGRAANRGPDIAWIADPSGNVVAIAQG
jgi:catechol 2,3-dioxygenase-like lactoylglutathione lyase family enzyme